MHVFTCNISCNEEKYSWRYLIGFTVLSHLSILRGAGDSRNTSPFNVSLMVNWNLFDHNTLITINNKPGD